MLIDGEKWACDACIRGHRVSTCHHADRELKHINKKGRPVTQCSHCRGLRKARSAHVKCDCGDKSHAKGQCSHIHKTDSKGEHIDGPILSSSSDDSAAGLHTCCCSHGERCSCALKKEPLDPLAEDDDLSPASGKASTTKPRLITTQSDGSLVVANGHHKPAHKHNDMAHRCGVPYKIPRSHSIHGSAVNAQRSVDSLPLTNTLDVSTTPSDESSFLARGESRLVRSEHNSPVMTSTPEFTFLNERPAPLDLTTGFSNDTSSQFQPSMNMHEPGYFNTSSGLDQFIYSAGVDPPDVDWSTFNFPLDADNNPFSTAYAQPPSYASLDYTSNDYPSNMSNGHPALTTSSSGDVSEVDEHNFSDPRTMKPTLVNPNAYSSESSDTAESSSYRLSNPLSTFGSMQQTSMPESFDIDVFLKEASAFTAFDNYNNTNDGAQLGQDIGYTDTKSVQNFVPTSMATSNNLELSSIKNETGVDLLWSNTPNSGNVNFGGDNSPEMPDSVWMS